ncbi:MAG: methyltransferase domain-containing protein, partial [Flavobacteriales bacterium]
MQANNGFLPAHSQQWLDLGCGTGAIAKKIAKHHQPVHAVDQSPAMLAHVVGVEGVTPVQADIRQLPFADQSIDRIASHFALHWLGPTILPELCRVMRSGGMLWLAIPVQGSFASVHRRYPDLPLFDFLPAEAWLSVAAEQAVEVVSVTEKCWSQPFDHLQDLLHTLKLMGGHRLGRSQMPVSLAQFRAWLRDVEPIALEYQVLYMQLRVL